HAYQGLYDLSEIIHPSLWALWCAKRANFNQYKNNFFNVYSRRLFYDHWTVIYTHTYVLAECILLDIKRNHYKCFIIYHYLNGTLNTPCNDFPAFGRCTIFFSQSHEGGESVRFILMRSVFCVLFSCREGCE
ncbi:unnamed protein product, partial [Pylaiella littoralis]